MSQELVGRRVRLQSCSDPYTKLAVGAEGTISMIDSLGTVHVNWDDGSTLGLVPGEDRWDVLPPSIPLRVVRMVDGSMKADEFPRETAIASIEAMGFEFIGENRNQVHRAELQGAPKFKGLCGPMWDGNAIRYE